VTEPKNAQTKAWYDSAYGQAGFSAQRRYPNEELLRFFGRHYFSLPAATRRNIRVLEVGSGSGANLWMIAREGFDAHGIELSPSGSDLCRDMLELWGTSATLKTADMAAAPYPDGYFDVILDVFSTYCLDEAGHARFLTEVKRLLKPSGRYFSYTPSKQSSSFQNPGPSQHLDKSTLDGIRRTGAPYAGNLYPFRFVNAEEHRAALEGCGMVVTYLETVGRTYRNRGEYFEFVVIVGEIPE
jgi:cyclopropane fatty-acyl-phospholipid synthase-like methyltransferase